MCDRLTDSEATWRISELINSGPITCDDAAQIVAGDASLYDLTDQRRHRCRIKARKILAAGVDAGVIRRCKPNRWEYAGEIA